MSCREVRQIVHPIFVEKLDTNGCVPHVCCIVSLIRGQRQCRGSVPMEYACSSPKVSPVKPCTPGCPTQFPAGTPGSVSFALCCTFKLQKLNNGFSLLPSKILPGRNKVHDVSRSFEDISSSPTIYYFLQDHFSSSPIVQDRYVSPSLRRCSTAPDLMLSPEMSPIVSSAQRKTSERQFQQ